jgi:hypothetical protein
MEDVCPYVHWDIVITSRGWIRRFIRKQIKYDFTFNVTIQKQFHLHLVEGFIQTHSL